MYHICDPLFLDIKKITEEMEETGGSNFTDESIVENFKNISYSKAQVITACLMNSRTCKEEFAETMTDEGLCYSINTVAEKELFRKDV